MIILDDDDPGQRSVMDKEGKYINKKTNQGSSSQKPVRSTKGNRRNGYMRKGGKHFSIRRFNDDIGTINPIGYDTQHVTASSPFVIQLTAIQVENCLCPHSLRNNADDLALTICADNDNADGNNTLCNPSSHLRVAHIPTEHLANTMTSATEVLFVRDLAWVFATHSELQNTILVTDSFAMQTTRNRF